jgi:hypothetical protein
MSLELQIRASRSELGCPEFLLRVPRPLASYFTCAKTPGTPVLDVQGLVELFKTSFAALGAVSLPQRSQGGDRRSEDMSEGRDTAPKAERAAHLAKCSA